MGKPGPKPKVRPADALAVFAEREDLGEPLTAPEIADALACSRRTALDKLHELGEADRLRSKQVGGRSRVWWEPIDEGNLARGDVVDETSDGDAVAASPRGNGDGAVASDVDEALSDLALGDDRSEAVREMHSYLTSEGTARKSDFANDVYPEYPAGYTSIGGWWNRLGKEALASLPGVEKPAEGHPIWRFSGE